MMATGEEDCTAKLRSAVRVCGSSSEVLSNPRGEPREVWSARIAFVVMSTDTRMRYTQPADRTLRGKPSRGRHSASALTSALFSGSGHRGSDELKCHCHCSTVSGSL